MQDPYEVLGLKRGATDKEIRSAYRKLAKQYHPDHNPNDLSAEERFKAVGSAHAFLSDKEKRASYDRGEIDAEGNPRAPFGGGAAHGFHAAQGFSRGAGFAGGRGFHRSGSENEAVSGQDFDAFFAEMLREGASHGTFRAGGFGASSPQRRGADRTYKLMISFEDAVLGKVARVTLPEAGTIEVKIPPGIEDGQTLRLNGKGALGIGEGAAPGDGLITVSVAPNKRYERVGRDLRAHVAVDLETAYLGGSLRVDTPKGSVTLRVPPHSDTGKVLRLSGRGVAEHKQHKAGDLYVTLQVKIGYFDSDIEKLLKSQKVAREEPT